MIKIHSFSKQVLLLSVFIGSSLVSYSQALLNADGVTDTYSLINSILAPGGTAEETPDAYDPTFGPHIKQVYDADLGKYVFEFYLHISNSNELQDESTGDTDRQRVEIKTYDASPDSLKGVLGETIKYKWRFKVPTGFQPSTNFTHIHQIKAVGGDDSNPIFTLTPRYNSGGNKLELDYYDGQTTNVQSKLAEVNLSSFENTWVEATEQIHIDSIHGSYSISINKVSDGTNLLTYSNSDLCTFRSTNTFTRPKWGIYRSILSISYLRDETMRFNSFSVQELKNLAQSISFPTLPASIYGDDNFDPGATSSVGQSLKVTYSSSNTSVAKIISSGSDYVNDSIQIVGAGTTTITASQVGDASYAAAASVQQTFTVAKATQTIAFGALTKALGDADFSPAIASSGLTVAYSSSNTAVATIVSGKIHIVGAGTTTITTSQAGNTNFSAAPDNAQTLTVTTSALYVYSPTSITVTSGTVGSGTYSSLASNDANYLRINSTASGTRKIDWYGSTFVSQAASSIAKLIVNFDGKNQTSKTQIIYLYNFTTSAWDQIDSRTVSSSDVTITYEQATPTNYISSGGEIRLRVYTSGGTQNYVSNTDWMQFTLQNISKSNQTITFNSLPAKSIGDADFSPGASASSGLAVSYTSSNTAVATIVSNQIHIVGVGTSTITASQGGDSYTNAASDVSQTLTVYKANQTITFGALTGKYTTDSDFNPGATLSSGLSASYASSNTAVATILNGKIHIVGVGTSTITASQAGDGNYNAATNVTQTLNVVANTGLYNENFNYSDGNLSTNGGYTEAGTYVGGTGRTVGGTALTYTDAGGSYVLSGSGKSMTTNIGTSATDFYDYKAFTASPVNSGIVYLSFLLKANANISPTNQEVMGLANGTSAGPKVLIGKTSAGYFKIGTVRGSTASADYKYATSPASLTVGSTYLIVLKYDFSSSTSSVYINPTLGGTEPASPEISDNTSATIRTQLTNLWFRANGSTLIQNYDLSSARVSNSWADAVGKYVSLVTYTISASSANLSMGAVSGGGNILTGTSVSVVASPLSGYRFVNWTENGSEVSTSSTYTFTASSARTLVANFAVQTANQTISFNALPAKTMGDADFAPGATVSSGLTVSYSSSNTAVATIVSGNIHIVGVGTSTITASQAGNGTYNAATNVNQTLTVVANPVLLDETFNYTDGSINGLGSWTEAGTHDGAGRTIGSPCLTFNNGVNLSYINSGIGKAMTNVIIGTSSDYKAYKPFNATAVNSGTLYLSLLLKTNANIASTNQEVFGMADGTSAGPKVLIGKTATGFYKIGTVRASSASADYKYAASPTSLTVGNTYLIVLKYDFASSTSSVYINPTLGGTEPASPEISDNTSVPFRTQLSNLWSRATGTVAQNYSVGGVRVSTSWAAAVGTTAYTPPVSSALTAPTTGTATSITSSGFTARWTNNDANAIGYTVKVYWGTSFVDSTTVSGQSTTSLAVSNLVPGLTYTYKVLANGDGTYHSNSVLSTSSASFTLSTAVIPANNLKIIFKLDDLGVLNSVFLSSPVWDYLKANNIKWGGGAIANRFDGTSLSVLSPYLNATNSVGDTLVEVWNHGLEHVTNEFSGTTYSYQKSNFDQATQLIKTYLGVQMHSFGTPYNASDATTNTVIGKDPNYKVFMFSDVVSATNGVTYLDNRVNMESATGVPGYSYFVDNYNAAKAGYTNYMVLQGHPNYYTAGSSTLDQFKLIVQFLISQGCEFVRPFDYYRSLSLTAPTNLSAVSVSETQINLTWTDNTTSESNYRIERSTDNTNWTLIATAAKNSTVYSDNSIVSGGTYYYRVYANCGIKSPYSNTAQTVLINGTTNASSLANISSTTNISVLNGGKLTIDTPTNVNSITIEGGGQLTNNSSNTLTANAFTINSNLNGTGTYVDNGTTIVNGSLKVNQYLTSDRNYYISSPVSGATSNVFSANSNFLYYYNESDNSWSQITNNATSIDVMKGYIANIASTGSVTFTGGVLNTGAQQIGITRHAGVVKEGFNLVGNPYPSYLNFETALASTNTANVSSTIWFRIKNSGTWVFDTYNAVSHIGTSNNNNSLIGVTANIPPMQSFWVRVTAGLTSGVFAVDNSMRSHQDQSIETNRFKAPATTVPVLHLQVTNGITSDETIVLFNSNASYDYDAYDSEKITNANNSIPEIYTLAGTEKLVINGLNSIQYNTEIPLGFTTGQSNTFTIKASQFSKFVSGTQIILRDKVLNVEQDLTVANYIFTSDVTLNNTSRFAVLFKAPAVATGINTANNNNVWISTNSNNQLMINGNCSVAVYNAIGQRIAAMNMTSNTTTLETPLQSGIYFVTIRNAGKSVTQKVIIN